MKEICGGGLSKPGGVLIHCEGKTEGKRMDAQGRGKRRELKQERVRVKACMGNI